MNRIRKALSAAKAKLAAAIQRVAALAASALTWFLLFAFSGMSLIASGVFVIAGLGWGLIACGIACLALAFFVQKGMTHG